MSPRGPKHVYGPVPSRRLGRSLGLDLVPLKTCTYDCVYCQLGRTTNKTVTRGAYVSADAILAELEQKLGLVAALPDYIGIAGSGEPTLNCDIGRVIRGIKTLTDIPVAVLTNGSLLWMTEVQDALMASDLVLPSLDTGDARLFRRVNRPHRSISFETMVDGLVSFTRCYPGEVWLEVLLLAGVTGIPEEVEKIAALVERIAPARVQLNTVCRPPAERSARPLSQDDMQHLKVLFPAQVDVISHVYQEKATHSASVKARREDVLALLRRRPCTAMDVAEGLDMHVNEAIKHLDALTKAGVVTTSIAEGRVFYASAGPDGRSRYTG